MDGVWSGRTDGDGPEHRRWHQAVRVLGGAGGAAPGGFGGIALVGFASDEGVRRNEGRPGAVEGPGAIRRALAPLAVHRGPDVVDAGDVVVHGADLEGGQAALGREVARLLDAGRHVVVLGGGHETAYGTYLGRRAAARTSGARTAILNLDAHFDLRSAPRPTSGTPFLQMAQDDERAGRDFRYTVLGINRDANTPVLFATADRLAVRHLLDRDCRPGALPAVLDAVDAALAGAEAVHLSIDLDVLPAAVAPGVSAPAALGVPLEVVLAVCERVARAGLPMVVDVVELCPRLDIDGRTARAAARLIAAIAHELAG